MLYKMNYIKDELCDKILKYIIKWWLHNMRMNMYVCGSFAMDWLWYAVVAMWYPFIIVCLLVIWMIDLFGGFYAFLLTMWKSY